jgi:glycosyltransferase involved in cell wall biosynthesis
MYVGRPLPHKNLKPLAEAFSIIKHKKPNLKLVIAGAKHPLYDEFERWAKREKIEGIELTGFVSEGQLRWLYENCAAYVFPSAGLGSHDARRSGSEQQCHMLARSLWQRRAIL